MPKFGRLLGVICLCMLAIAAGCAGDPGGERTRPAIPEATVTPVSVRETHPDVTRENAGTVAKRFESAIGYNRRITPNTTELGVTPEVVSVNVTERGYLVRLRVGVSAETYAYDAERNEWVGGDGTGWYAVNYFANDTVVRRSESFDAGLNGYDPHSPDHSAILVDETGES